APSVMTREDPRLGVQRPGPVPIGEYHVVMIRTGLTETVHPAMILLCDEHPVPVLFGLLHGWPSIVKSESDVF
ncbi:MAG: hypothetical protein ACE5K9_06790, partial [Candidatus Methylomirabilales bacterium]